MTKSHDLDLSTEPLASWALDDDQKNRLADLLDRYMLSLESGAPLDTEVLASENPDLAEPLAEFIDSLAQLQKAAEASEPSHNAPVHEVPASYAPAAFDEPNSDGVKRLGDFVLEDEIGRGGMGVVYRARQQSLDREVALKVLPLGAILDPKQIARFKIEAQAAAQIHHPNIVPVYSVGSDRGIHFYAMQLIDGLPLDEAIDTLKQRRRKPRPAVRVHEADVRLNHQSLLETGVHARHAEKDVKSPSSVLEASLGDIGQFCRTVAELGVQAAEALHAAHECGVVHRDVKPSNLLLDQEGKLWVTDFGLARFQEKAALSKTGDLIGTWRYMSPEQASGKASFIDQRTDVYSLGATLYELLALRPAVRGADGAALLRRIELDDPIPLRRQQPQIPAALENIIAKAIAKSRDERYLTAQDLADDLQRYLQGLPTIAKPPTLLERSVKWAARRKPLVAASAAVTMILAVACVGASLLVAREKIKTDQSYARAEQYRRDAQNAVDEFGARFADRLKGVPGAARIRHEMLAATLEYYERFVEQAADDPTLQTELATTYGKIGSLTAKIGSTDRAVAAHRKAVALFEALTHRCPHRSEYREQLALSQNNLALTLQQVGHLQQASDMFEYAIAEQERLLESAAKHDGETLFRQERQLAASLTNFGLLHNAIHDHPSAVEALDRAINIRLKHVQLQDDVESHRLLATAYNSRSSVEVTVAPAEAERFLRLAETQLAVALERDPNNREALASLAATYSNLAGREQMEEGQSLEMQQKAVAIQRKLLAFAPEDRRHRQSLAVGLNNLGLMHCRLQSQQEAEAAFEESLRLHEALAAANPNDVITRSSMGGVFNNLGIVLESQDRLEEAAVAFRSAARHQHIALNRSPRTVRFRSHLSKHYFNLGRVLRANNLPRSALNVALKRRELWGRDARRLVSVAEELALAARMMTSTDPALSDALGQTQATLEQARAAGGCDIDKEIGRRETLAMLRDDSHVSDGKFDEAALSKTDTTRDHGVSDVIRNGKD